MPEVGEDIIFFKKLNTIRTSAIFNAGVLVTVSLVCSSAFFSTDVHAASGQLVSQWKFDETVAGSVAVDATANNDAIPTNDPIPSLTVAPVNFTNPRSASFDGSNYFTIDRPVSDSFTICAWVKTASTGGGVDHWTSAPIMDSETGGVDYDFGFGVGNGGRLMFGNGGDPVGGGGIFDAQVNGTTQINDDEWHNVCVTRNNTTGVVNLYVDAVLDGTGVTGVGMLTSNPDARIGYGYDGAALFQGLIDDVRVYDSDLTPEQLQALADGDDDPITPRYILGFELPDNLTLSDISVQSGSSIVLPNGPDRGGFRFMGWNTTAGGTGTMHAANTNYVMPGGNTTLYAVYEIQNAPNSIGAPNAGVGAANSNVIPVVTFFVIGILSLAAVLYSKYGL